MKQRPTEMEIPAAIVNLCDQLPKLTQSVRELLQTLEEPHPYGAVLGDTKKELQRLVARLETSQHVLGAFCERSARAAGTQVVHSLDESTGTGEWLSGKANPDNASGMTYLQRQGGGDISTVNPFDGHLRD